MKVTLLGTGTSLPDPDRVQSGILIEAGAKSILLDVGSGVLHRLIQTGFDINHLEFIFFSHFHIDHCSDFLTLCQSLWLNGFDKELALYGPPPMKQWLRGLHDISYQYIRDKVQLRQKILREDEEVYLDDIAVSTCPTTHSTQDSRAFKVEFQGKSVVFTSDTAPCRDVIELARGVDLLIHECNWLDGKHPQGIHTSPSELMSVVEEAAPKRVALVHMWPEVVEAQRDVVRIVKRRTDAEVMIGEDLMHFTL